MPKKMMFILSLLLTALLTGVVGAGAGEDLPGADRVAEMRALIQAQHAHGFTTASDRHPPERSPRERNLSLIGSHDLGGVGFNSDVWALGATAYVGTWGLFTGDGAFCPNTGTKVIDIRNPASPVWINSLPAPAGTQTNDVKVANVRTPYFRGDLLVVSNEDCAPGGGRGFELWDVSDPANAEFLGRFGPEVAFDVPDDLVDIGFGVHNVFIFKNRGRVYVGAVLDFAEIFQVIFGAPTFIGDLRIVDVTDPRNPVQVGDWGTVKNLGLDPFPEGGINFLHDVWMEDDIAYLSYWDAGLILLDVSDPTDPAFISQTKYFPAEEGNTHVAVPARGGNLVITGDEDFSPFPWGFVRMFDARNINAPVQVGTFATENALKAPPPDGDFTAHNIIVRGSTAYISWYSDGIRVIDFSQPRNPREIAAFVPPAVADPFGILPTAPELWGVYLQGELVLGSDMNAGLYILRHTP